MTKYLYGQHSVISSPNRFKIEAPWRYSIVLATWYLLNYQSVVSVSILPSEKGRRYDLKQWIWRMDFWWREHGRHRAKQQWSSQARLPAGVEVDMTHMHAIDFLQFYKGASSKCGLAQSKPACDSANPRTWCFWTIWSLLKSAKTRFLNAAATPQAATIRSPIDVCNDSEGLEIQGKHWACFSAPVYRDRGIALKKRGVVLRAYPTCFPLTPTYH